MVSSSSVLIALYTAPKDKSSNNQLQNNFENRPHQGAVGCIKSHMIIRKNILRSTKLHNFCTIIFKSQKFIVPLQQIIRKQPKIITTMARPIKETPILFGEDALRFIERANQIEGLSDEQRAINSRTLEHRIANAKNQIEVCW